MAVGGATPPANHVVSWSCPFSIEVLAASPQYRVAPIPIGNRALTLPFHTVFTRLFLVRGIRCTPETNTGFGLAAAAARSVLLPTTAVVPIEDGSKGTEMSSNGASRAGGGGRGGPQQVARVITSPAWDLRLKRCEVAKGDLNEVSSTWYRRTHLYVRGSRLESTTRPWLFPVQLLLYFK